MNIRNILKMVQLQPRAETSLFNGNIRFVGFTSLQFHPDPDFKIFIHNLPIPVSPHIHDYYEAVYVYEGSFVYQVKDRTISLSIGDFIMIPPGCVHSILDSSKVCQGINLLINPDYLEHTLKPLLAAEFMDQSRSVIHVTTTNDPRMRSLVDTLLEEHFFAEKQNRQFINCYLALILNTCERISRQMQASAKEQKEARKELITAKILWYIHLNYKEVSLPQLSGRFAYSQNYISHLIREATGYTFSEYKLKIQLDTAIQLLSQNDLSVNKIADLTGFTNYSYFYKKFREKVQMTPAEYRKELIINTSTDDSAKP